MSSWKNDNKFSRSNVEFTLDFLRKNWNSIDQENLLVSSIGIMIINIMLLEGAEGVMADQIMSVLRLGPAFKDIGTIRNESRLL